MKKYYLGERSNPQFTKPYYKMYGQLSKKDVKAKEKALYGSMTLTAYDTKELYEAAIQEKRDSEFNIH